MSRGLAASNATAVAASVVRPIIFAELDFTGGFSRSHSGIGTITWGGFDWLGVGTLGSIDGLEEKADLTRKTVVFTLTGIPNTLLSVVSSENYQGRSAKVYLGFFDAATYQLVATPETLFTGKMDKVNTIQGETFSITITAESRLAAWSRPVVRRYNDRDQQSRFTGDLGLQFISQAAQKEIVWGRKT